MDSVTKHYSRGDITVIWKPGQCIHSRICWTGLADVFDPRKRPWVNMEGADIDRIIEQVSQCPSGALSYVSNKREADDQHNEAEMTTTVEAVKNGPLMIYGKLSVKDSKGNEVQKNKVTAFCRCGASSNKPFCDGSHIRIGFKDEE